jgi:membrane-bound serine protease (ClpP class)
MIGHKGIVVSRLDPSGYVRIRGELWKAETEDGIQTVEKGRTVTVLHVKGLQLYVQADPSEVSVEG